MDATEFRVVVLDAGDVAVVAVLVAIAVIGVSAWLRRRLRGRKR